MRLFHRERFRFLAPLLFLAACILAYGVQIPWLGFYLDDWVILNAYNMGGAERVFEYAYLDNRPLVAWIWILTFELFGVNPAPLQAWALFWRWMSVVVLWLTWRELWPNATRQVTIAALLFAVYPLFRQQPASLAFIFQWMCLFLFGLSLYAMVRAVRQPRFFVPWMAVAVLTGVVQLFSQEYYVGLELLRPFVLWLALRAVVPDGRVRLKRVLLDWLPFLLIMGGYLIWRVSLMPTPGADRNAPVMMYGLFKSPLSSLPQLAKMLLQDTVEGLLGVWYKTFQPSLLVFTPPANLVAWAAAGAMFLLSWVFFRRRPAEPAAEVGIEEPWYQSAIPFGALAMLLGFAPAWAVGRQLYTETSMYNDRFGLAATIGAAILVVALVELLLKKESYALALLCLLVGLGTAQNFRFVSNYRYSWEKQRQLYWQLKWRAPGLEEGTAIIGNGALIGYMGSWATISSLQQMYAPHKDVHSVDYWYLDANDLVKEDLTIEGKVLVDRKKYMRFKSLARNSLVIEFAPEKLQCLWVLSPRDQASLTLDKKLKDHLSVSNLERIKAEPDLPLRQDIFGPEIPRNWCYYFQTGDLAYQFEDWETVVRLWLEAEQTGKRPRNGVEYRPFIHGFAHTGDWQRAIELTHKASFPRVEMRPLLCNAWREVALSTPDTTEREQTLYRVMDAFECQDELRNILQGP